MNADKEKEQITKGLLAFAVLVELSRKEQYGVELLESLVKTPFSTQAGTLYPLLSKMHRQGIITHRWETSPFGPARKYYQLTQEGRVHLKTLRSHWTKLNRILGGSK